MGEKSSETESVRRNIHADPIGLTQSERNGEKKKTTRKLKMCQRRYND